MFKKELFDKAVEKSGYRRRFISDSIGIAYDSFVRKGAGRLEWKICEVKRFQEVIGLDDSERDAIFFG